MIENVDALIQQGFRIPVAVLGGKTATKIGSIRMKKFIKKHGKKSILLIHSDEVEDFLSHFGILGMRWGVHKAEERQASFERRAKRYEAKAKRIQGQIDRVSGSRINPEFKKMQLADLQRAKTQALKDAEAKRKGKLSSGQKKALFGGGAVAAVIAAYSTYQLANSGELRRSIERGKTFLTGSESPIFKVKPELSDPNLDAEGILSKVVKHINPNYGAPGTKMNCRRATFAYEMRRRGYDVAATRTLNGRGQTFGGVYNALAPEGQPFIPSSQGGVLRRLGSETRKLEKGMNAPFAKSVTEFSKRTIKRDSIFPSLAKMPNGSRGELFLQWKSGGAHSVAWEVIKGQPVVFDAQTGKAFKTFKELKEYAGEMTPRAAKLLGVDELISGAAITRLDDVKLNTNFLLRWLKNAA